MQTPQEGLRERKKRETRQRISDAATQLFLSEGFDAVPITAVAAASNVSEKTVYNYFPTKEALVFDREPDLVAIIRGTFSAESNHASPSKAMEAVIAAQVDQLLDRYGPVGDDLSNVLAFIDLIASAPSLVATQRLLDDRLRQEVATSVGLRAGRDSLDPEPQAAAHALFGLWAVAFQSLGDSARAGLTARVARNQVRREVARATSALEAGLASWTLG